MCTVSPAKIAHPYRKYHTPRCSRQRRATGSWKNLERLGLLHVFFSLKRLSWTSWVAHPYQVYFLFFWTQICTVESCMASFLFFLFRRTCCATILGCISTSCHKQFTQQKKLCLSLQPLQRRCFLLCAPPWFFLGGGNRRLRFVAGDVLNTSSAVVKEFRHTIFLLYPSFRGKVLWN